MAELHARNVGSAVHYPLLHKLSAYVGGGTRRAGPLTNAEYVGPRILTLPLFPAMSPDDVRYVAGSLRAILERHAAPPATAHRAQCPASELNGIRVTRQALLRGLVTCHADVRRPTCG